MGKEKVCRLDELGEGTVRRVVLGTRAVALVRCAGKLYAFADTCPHKGGFLSEGQVHAGRGELICPWHRFRFRLADGASVTNPELVARTYPVSVEDGDVVIGLP